MTAATLPLRCFPLQILPIYLLTPRTRRPHGITEDMNQDVLERILQCQTLPSLPAVAIRILELTSDLNVSIAELARTIENDQGLTAKILRTVNSSFYGLRKPCPTIHQAVVILGLSAVKSLALGFSLVTSIKGVVAAC